MKYLVVTHMKGPAHPCADAPVSLRANNQLCAQLLALGLTAAIARTINVANNGTVLAAHPSAARRKPPETEACYNTANRPSYPPHSLTSLAVWSKGRRYLRW